MHFILEGNSKRYIVQCFIALYGATLGVALLSRPANGSCYFIFSSVSAIRSRFISAYSRGDGARKAGALYGNIERDHPMTTDTATAVRFIGATDSQGFPPAAAWETTPPLRFDADWQGKNADELRETEVRLLWTPETLYLRFQARYRNINLFPDAEPDGRRNQLWDRDVAEAFLQPDSSDPGRYKEFEISPNGFWIDLDIAPGEKHDLQSGLKRRVQIKENEKLWVAELYIPMKSLVARFDRAAIWRANFYRVEGPTEPRFYSAWRPTGTPQPNFHVPKAFGRLLFVEPPPASFH